ncbi:hypothetical protein NQ318_021838 [Aromia moschata]|uniref:Transposase n=1 Tax=Aromia moschata TaxID=1265417 RepID=A0AAV8Z8S7_9CUCU|nr:hypothetical protein NQ318_021838 [Aromia moschata]
MPRHLSEAQRARAIAKLEENWSLTEVAAELNNNTEASKQCGFKNCVAAHKIFLTEEHKQRRVQFANEYLQGNEFWNNVMFSDEKTFQSSKNERLHVYRSRNTIFEENYTLSTTNSGRFSVNVWAWISVHDPGLCWQIDGRLTSAHYTNILENVMLPSLYLNLEKPNLVDDVRVPRALIDNNSRPNELRGEPITDEVSAVVVAPACWQSCRSLDWNHMLFWSWCFVFAKRRPGLYEGCLYGPGIAD